MSWNLTHSWLCSDVRPGPHRLWKNSKTCHSEARSVFERAEESAFSLVFLAGGADVNAERISGAAPFVLKGAVVEFLAVRRELQQDLATEETRASGGMPGCVIHLVA
jgi:hypothetical protein